MRTLIFTLALLAPLHLFALELVMVEQPGCYYCKKWQADIGPIYPKAHVAQDAPLRIEQLSAVADDIELERPVIYTPTFLLVEDGVELSRIEGYQSEDFFWALTEGMVAKALETAND